MAAGAEFDSIKIKGQIEVTGFTKDGFWVKPSGSNYVVLVPFPDGWSIDPNTGKLVVGAQGTDLSDVTFVGTSLTAGSTPTVAYTQATKTLTFGIPKGDKGETGNGISGEVFTYQVSASSTVVPTGTWLTDIPDLSAQSGKLLWTRRVTSYTTGSPATSYSVLLIGVQGKDGVGIASTTVVYQVGTDDTTTPTGTWVSTPPTVAKGSYLWKRTTTTYTGTVANLVEYDVTYRPKDGAVTGNDQFDGTSEVLTASTSYIIPFSASRPNKTLYINAATNIQLTDTSGQAMGYLRLVFNSSSAVTFLDDTVSIPTDKSEVLVWYVNQGTESASDFFITVVKTK